MTAGGAIVFTRMLVMPARTGDVVTLSCNGRKCPFKTRRVSVRKDGATLSLLRQVRASRLRDNATFVVRDHAPRHDRLNTRDSRRSRATSSLDRAACARARAAGALPRSSTRLTVKTVRP